jgi:hypothetical protein
VDYFGAVLNRAARVMAAGHGGQVLLAESTAGLLSGVDLVDLGPRRLRDLPNPVWVFQVRAPSLQTELTTFFDPYSQASSNVYQYISECRLALAIPRPGAINLVSGLPTS